MTLLGLIFYTNTKRKGLIFFLTGLAAGIGFGVNNLVLMYFFAIGIFCFLRSEFWKKTNPSLNWQRIFFLEGVNVPNFLRMIIFIIHVGVSAFILWQIISFFAGVPVLTLGALKIKMASPPFLIKKVKKIVYLLCSEVIVLNLLIPGLKKTWKNIKAIIPLVSGFLLGGSPAFLYSLLGGEGYRLIHGSGMILAKDLPAQFHNVVWEWFAKDVLGVQSIQPWAVLILCAVLFLAYGFFYRKELAAIIRLAPHKYSYAIFPFLLTLVVLSICLFNNLQANRYLIPCYFSVSVILALALWHMKNKIGVLSWVLLMLLLVNNAYANFHFIKTLPSQDRNRRGHESILPIMF